MYYNIIYSKTYLHTFTLLECQALTNLTFKCIFARVQNYLYNGIFSKGLFGYPKHLNLPIISKLLFPRAVGRATTYAPTREEREEVTSPLACGPVGCRCQGEACQ